jgi:hypothetical protein
MFEDYSISHPISSGKQSRKSCTFPTDSRKEGRGASDEQEIGGTKAFLISSTSGEGSGEDLHPIGAFPFIDNWPEIL